jgi:hypothetical protein
VSFAAITISVASQRVFIVVVVVVVIVVVVAAAVAVYFVTTQSGNFWTCPPIYRIVS